ncbi:GNAT family protein [Arenimonas sp. GDDSR-1]|uniref:GNAT family N-acetyltransferase n=1 Tax=Arenimonas sp. GDDSR-1 TaxID=2950125 RepID=UPI0026074EA4|nr:GNAT family protein [Arenimonas sp. GDDSR-1]
MRTDYGVRLEPLAQHHAEGLLAASGDGAIWQLNYTTAPGPDLESVRNYIAVALAGQQRGECRPFAVVDTAGRVLGSTRFYDIDAATPTVAIGYTWYAASVQRTHVNTACKRLLLEEAFEGMAVTAVYFHTSHLNLRSQAAIERLGARRDGILRQHKRHKDGSLRDTYTYSILDREWPAIRQRLDARLSAG